MQLSKYSLKTFIKYFLYTFSNKKLKLYKFKKFFFPFNKNNFLQETFFIKKSKYNLLKINYIPFFYKNIKEFTGLFFFLKFKPGRQLSVYKTLFDLNLVFLKKKILINQMNLVYNFFFCYKNNFYSNIINFNYYIFIINNLKFNFNIKKIIFKKIFENSWKIFRSKNNKKLNFFEEKFLRKVYSFLKFKKINQKIFLKINSIKKETYISFFLKKNKKISTLLFLFLIFFLGLFLKLFY